jgi:hypothetical protein
MSGTWLTFLLRKQTMPVWNTAIISAELFHGGATGTELEANRAMPDIKEEIT